MLDEDEEYTNLDPLLKFKVLIFKFNKRHKMKYNKRWSLNKKPMNKGFKDMV